MQQKTNYITNKQLLAEIHRSKTSYCYFVEPGYSNYDAIVTDVKDITETFANSVLAAKANQRRRDANEIRKTSVDQLVFRVMTFEHIPLCSDKKRRSRAASGEGRLRTNFPPFKHYVLRESEVVEVGRSHWKGDLETGEFSLDHGKINNRLAYYFMLLVERYSRRANWRGYTYIDEMRGSALAQLSQVGLTFDESKGDNPFAYYTQVMKSSFTRVFNVEKKVQNIRDDMLVMAGAAPSYTRQIEHELSQKFATQAPPPTKAVPTKRGRKAKVTVEIEPAYPDSED
jgi:hypothetical protein